MGPIWAIPIASILIDEAPKLRVMLVGLISTVDPPTFSVIDVGEGWAVVRRNRTVGLALIALAAVWVAGGFLHVAGNLHVLELTSDRQQVTARLRPELPGVRVLGNLDDDQIMVGPSTSWPWTTYVMADVPDIETVTAACNLFRVTPVGDGTYKLWKYCRVETRIGRELVFPA